MNETPLLEAEAEVDETALDDECHCWLAPFGSLTPDALDPRCPIHRPMLRNPSPTIGFAAPGGMPCV